MIFNKNKEEQDKAEGGKPSEPSVDAKPPVSAPAPSADKSVGGVGGAKKAQPSILSADIEIRGNVRTSGDVQVLGKVDGDIHAHLLTIGEGAMVKGEVVADDLVIHGRIAGTVRGLKVRLTASAQVKGDIIHKTIAIESGAHFEGSVTRQDDPLSGASGGGGGSGSGGGSAGGGSGGSASASSGTASSTASSASSTAGANGKR